jgi:hypothetical protein
MSHATYLKCLRVLVVLFLLTLAWGLSTGCSILNLPTYNESEYAQLIDIAVVSSVSNCKTEEVERLLTLSHHVLFYSAYLPHNEHIAKGVAEMDKTVQSLTQAQPESVYCHLKLRAITDMATTLADAAGGKTR